VSILYVARCSRFVADGVFGAEFARPGFLRLDERAEAAQ
jgi:hypothetical protein